MEAAGDTGLCSDGGQAAWRCGGKLWKTVSADLSLNGPQLPMKVEKGADRKCSSQTQVTQK